MEFKQLLERLKKSNEFNRSCITKEIITNIRRITQTELLHILEMLENTADMELQIKLISILSAYLLFNKTNRDVIIKRSFLYDTLCTILVRGLPMKTAVTLDFATSLLYDEGGACRGRSLTLHARSMLRASGCLTAMTHLFTNYMLYSDTWKALCRCIAEVCHGSEVNQTFCSHLVPLCVQRCLQGNLEVLPVLQSLLSNHKGNTSLFLDTDGMAVFNREEYFRYETCLQLLNTIVQIIDVETLRIIRKQSRMDDNLQNLLQLETTDSRIRQWATIILYYMESKLKENGHRRATTTRSNVNKNNELPTNVDDTQVLFQNIMTEIIFCPSKTDAHNPWQRIYDMPDKLSNIINGPQNAVEQIKLYHSESSLHNKIARTRNSGDLYSEELTFSFLMEQTLKCDQSGLVNNGQTNKLSRTVTDRMTYNKHRDERRCQLSDTIKTLNDQNIMEFKPTFVSTPKKVVPKKLVSMNINSPKRSFMTDKKSGNKNSIIHRRVRKKSISQDSRMQDSIKQRSISSRLLDAINESCTTFIKSVKNMFTGKKYTNSSIKETKNINSVNDQSEQSYCSYSFTNYMRKREAELVQNKQNLSSEIITYNSMNTCKTCDDTILLNQKFANDDHLKMTVKKLKLGINLYGCDFKRISKTIWPRETYMTPTVLYNLYRKLILK